MRMRIGPLTAAAAVITIAAVLVLVRTVPNGGAVPAERPAPSSGGVPRYYVALTPESDTPFPLEKLIVGDIVTGAKLATISPPSPGSSFAGVTAAADDQTFVVDTQLTSLEEENAPWQPRTWYLLRVRSGSSDPARLTRLPVPATPTGTAVNGIALSPDGTELAVILQPNALGSPAGPVLLRVYSVATGAVLRTWSAASGTQVGTPKYGGPDANTSLFWLDGMGRLAFVVNGWAVRVLDTTAHGGDLIADSRPVFSQPPVPLPSNSSLRCQSAGYHLFVSPDGKTVTCGAAAVLPGPTRNCGRPSRIRLGLLQYPAADSGHARTLYTSASACAGVGYVIEPLWTNDSGGTLIGYLDTGRSESSSRNGQFGVVSGGRFKPLSAPPTNYPDRGVAW
jgi:hypothetical protein